MGNRLDRGLRLGLAAAAIAGAAYGLSGRPTESGANFRTLLPSVHKNSEPFSSLPRELPPHIRFIPEASQTINKDAQTTVVLQGQEILLVTGQMLIINGQLFHTAGQEGLVFAIGATSPAAVTVESFQNRPIWMGKVATGPERAAPAQVASDTITASKVQAVRMSEVPNCLTGCSLLNVRSYTIGYQKDLSLVNHSLFEAPQQPPQIIQIQPGTEFPANPGCVTSGDVEPNRDKTWHDSDPTTGLITVFNQRADVVGFPFGGSIFCTSDAAQRQEHIAKTEAQQKAIGCSARGCRQVDILPYPGKRQGE